MGRGQLHVWHHSEGVGGAAWIGTSKKQEVERGLARGSRVVRQGWGQEAGDVPRGWLQVVAGLHQGSVQGTRRGYLCRSSVRGPCGVHYGSVQGRGGIHHGSVQGLWVHNGSVQVTRGTDVCHGSVRGPGTCAVAQLREWGCSPWLSAGCGGQGTCNVAQCKGRVTRTMTQHVGCVARAGTGTEPPGCIWHLSGPCFRHCSPWGSGGGATWQRHSLAPRPSQG